MEVALTYPHLTQKHSNIPMIPRLLSPGLLQCSLVISSALISCATAEAAEFKFDFNSGKAQPGFTQITSQTAYDATRGFGFLDGAAATPDTPRVFAVDVPEGNYDVTIRFGNPASATSTVLKAESRRLMIEKVETAPGKFETCTFTVNVRKPAISTGGTTSLNEREKGPPPTPDWDDHLTFEFNGKQPGVASMEIKPAKEAITVFLAGDSTVTDQRNEPWAGWGQMLPRFFGQSVAVSNQAESGLALYSFERQKRLEKVLSMMKKGDCLFIQFGHNDQKDKSPDAGPFTSYKANLKRFVEAARSKGGIPVLVTPMERRRWKGNEPEPTLADYAEAVRQVGTEEKAPVIDLNAMSLKLYAALGPENSKKAFVHYPANTFPGQDKPLKDDTHHNAYGGYELARCVVEGIRANVPELAKRLAKDAGAFDPAKPDAPEKVDIPPSPASGTTATPAGS
jgi:lysophospholipase L1-like esterase